MTTSANQPSHVVNINDKMQDRIISMANQEIAATKVLIEKLMPEFEAKELQLHMAQEEFDKVNKQISILKGDIERDANIIRTMRHFEDIKADKQLRVVGVEKPTGTTGYKSPKKMSWLQAASDILNKENRFLTFPELWQIMGNNAELVAIADSTATGFKNMRNAVSNNLTIHATTDKKHGKSKSVILYKEKFGLPEWLDNKGVVVPKYLKEFMYAAS